MRALIIGGTGFIGSHLTDRLLKDGHSLKVISNSTEKYRDNPTDVDYIFGNYLDTELLAKALSNIDIVYHLASSSIPATAYNNPTKDIQDNLIGSIKLFDLMLEKDVNKILFLSSGGTVYGSPEVLPIPESHPLRPTSSYGIVKVAIENYLSMYQQKGLQSIIIRPSNPYGPRQNFTSAQGLISTVMYKIIHNEPIVIWGDGNTVRDYIYMDDLINLIAIAGDSESYGIYNAGSGEGYSINNIISIISKIINTDIKIEYKDKRVFDIEKVILDNSKAKQVFNWEPKITLGNGIQKHWDWLSSYLGKK